MQGFLVIMHLCGLGLLGFGSLVFLDALLKGPFITWVKSRVEENRKTADHARKLERLEIEHKQRLELAASFDTTLHVLIADQPLGESLRDRLNEAFPPPPKTRVEEQDGDEQEQEDEAKDKKPRRKRKNT